MDDPKEILEVIRRNIHLHRIFLKTVESVFREDPLLGNNQSVIHTIKTRIKDDERIEEKIRRKNEKGVEVTKENAFDQITDLAGLRVIHLHSAQFTPIHECIQRQLKSGDWVLFEEPKAYTWDPESSAFFESHQIKVHVKESFYTSIHYVVRPRRDSVAACEIQVRTLFEEIWGEIDHLINYPFPTANRSCREQIRVLARLVGAGSRLADSIFQTHMEGLPAAKETLVGATPSQKGSLEPTEAPSVPDF